MCTIIARLRLSRNRCNQFASQHESQGQCAILRIRTRALVLAGYRVKWQDGTDHYVSGDMI